MKTITPDNYVVRPFLTHKTQEYDYEFLGTGNPPQVSIDVAVAPPTGSWYWDTTEPLNASGIYQRALHASVQHLLTVSGSSALTGSTLYVVSMAQQAFGEKVQPGSFILGSSATINTLIDDGNGNVVPASNTGSVVGHIFYGMGVAVVKQASGAVISADGMNLTTGSAVEVTFDATHTIYEHQVICTMEEGEFNFSTNPSMHDKTPPRRLDLYASGTLTPYMTTVGLYTDGLELVAIGKFPRPIKRVPESQQTVILRFDV